MKEEVVAGLISGRHKMPVDLYIYDDIDDVTDYKYLYAIAYDFIMKKCKPGRKYGRSLSQVDYTDVEIYVGTPLVLYVTGLTPAIGAVTKVCAKYGVPLTLMHYDKDSGNYRSQRVF